MKGIFTEKTLVGVLFILVLITFSMAQKETKRMEQLYNAGQTSIKNFPSPKPVARTTHPVNAIITNN